MKVVFARVGSMKFYDGISMEDDSIEGGGEYNKVTNDGFEQFNFRDVEGYIYGYCQSSYRKGMVININLKRIDLNVSSSDEFIDDVMVIFFSKNGKSNHQTIVGWYQNCKVYRKYQPAQSQHKRNKKSYNLVCDAANATLLPENKRNHCIAGGGLERSGRPGQSNAFYVLDGKYNRREDQWISDAIEYVRSNN